MRFLNVAIFHVGTIVFPSSHMIMLASNGRNGNPIATPWICMYISTLKENGTDFVYSK